MGRDKCFVQSLSPNAAETDTTVTGVNTGVAIEVKRVHANQSVEGQFQGQSKESFGT